MDIEELVKKHYEEWPTVTEAFIQDQMRAALTELAQGYEERIRQMEAERVPACRGRNCGATDGISHSQECRNEHDAACGYAVSIPVNTLAYWIDRLDGYGNKFNQQLIAELNTLLAAAPQPKKEAE